MARSTSSKWLLGCGIGCGVVLLLGIFLGVGGGLFISHTLKGFNSAIETRQQLDEAYGQITEFTPAQAGAVPAERMEAFLTVREALGPMRERLTASFDDLMVGAKRMETEEGKAIDKIRQVLKLGRIGLGLGPLLGEFYQVRNQSLLEMEMGLGEYVYIYAMGYYQLLGESPDDGPDEDRVQVDVTEDDQGIVVITDEMEEWEDDEDWDDSQRHHQASHRRLSRRLLAMVQNQLAALDSLDTTQARVSWRDSLVGEIEACQADRLRLPWQDGLPPALAASLEPYRDRLEATYDPVANAFELSRHRKKGMSIHSD
jgi:hypothetical protein